MALVMPPPTLERSWTKSPLSSATVFVLPPAVVGAVSKSATSETTPPYAKFNVLSKATAGVLSLLASMDAVLATGVP